MKESLKFCELSSAYSLNLHNLNEARKVFEEECIQFNEHVENKVKTHKIGHNSDKSKFLPKVFTWGNNHPWCTMKEGNWKSFVQGTTVELNLRVPGRQKFENNIGFLRFEISYLDEVRKFVFKVKFENQYTKNEFIDEKVIDLASKRPEDFPSAKLIKSSTGIISVWELDENLINKLSSIITNSMLLVEEAISHLYPETSYGNVSSEESEAS